MTKLVWTPTNAWWLNRIECQFTELKNYDFDNTYYRTDEVCRKEMIKFFRYRNARNKKSIAD